jgi:predicted nucleotidyltransferase
MILVEFLENKLGRKVDLLTPDGIETIRIKHLAEHIKKSIVYV